MFGSSVSCRASASLMMMQSTTLIVSMTASFIDEIQKFIVSIATNSASGHLLADLFLQHRQDVREKEQLGAFRVIGKLRIERLEHVQLRVQRVGRVHVVIVAALPEERFAVGHDLDVVRVDRMTLENVPFFLAKIAADHADRVHLCEKARRQPKMRRRTAKISSRLPKGVSRASNATEPTTVNDI